MTNQDWLSDILTRLKYALNHELTHGKPGAVPFLEASIAIRDYIDKNYVSKAKLDEAIPEKQLTTLLEGMEDTKYMDGWKAGFNDAIEQFREALK